MTANSWYRRSVFNYKGNREYTRTGYEAASARFIEKDLDVDCSERHYMITGSNSGIGLQTALEVARRGGVIHMVCRNKEAATKARSEIITTTGNDKIHLHIVDLAKPREVIQWAQRFAAQHEKLHVLIHNAGCMVHERKVDQDGIECNFAVNTLAVHILTLSFLPLLQKSEDPRVVMVSSAGLLCVRLDPHDLMHSNLEPFNGSLIYSQNKRQQVVMTLWYAQRYNKVHFSSMHPGWADTPAVRTSIPQFYEMMKDNLRTPAQGADTVVWLAISEAALKHPSGLFFQDREPVSTHFPLAWTKSSIEEEDILMNNIQKIYTEIHNKMLSPDTQAAASTQHEAPPDDSKTEQKSSTESPEHEEEKADTSQNPLAPEADPVTYPVLPPPPPPAEKASTAKSEVQEIAEIHAPPASSKLKDVTPEPIVTPEPTVTSEPKVTPEPTVTPEPSATPEPKVTPELTVTPEPDVTPEATVTVKAITEACVITPEHSSVTPELSNTTPEPDVTPDAASVTPETSEDPEPSHSSPVEGNTEPVTEEEAESTTEKEKESEGSLGDADDEVSSKSKEVMPEPEPEP